MHCVDEGTGPLALMVHGNPTSSYYFRSLVAALKGSRRCLAPDHVGMGRSPRPTDAEYAYTLKARIDDLDALVARRAPDGPVDLIVHDWGGMIGMGWAARNPERVRSIVAMNTSCFRLPQSKPFPPLLRFMRGAGGWLLRGSEGFRRMVLRGASARGLAPEVEREYLAPARGWDNSRAYQRFVQDIPLEPGDRAWDEVLKVEAALPRFRETPVLLPWGMKDWVFDRHFLDGWRDRFPRAEERRFEDAGHLLLEDAPERVVPLIADFLSRAAA